MGPVYICESVKIHVFPMGNIKRWIHSNFSIFGDLMADKRSMLLVNVYRLHLLRSFTK